MEDRTLRATDTVEIGQTGLRVSRLGLGGVALSGAPPVQTRTRPQRKQRPLRSSSAAWRWA